MDGIVQSAIIPELEGLFRSFPDVPREVILKIELLSHGHWFTDAALAFAGDLAKALDERKDLLETAYEHFAYDPTQVWKAYGVPLAPGAAAYYLEKGYITRGPGDDDGDFGTNP